MSKYIGAYQNSRVLPGGSESLDEPHFQWQNFLQLKLTPNLTALELSSCYLHTGVALTTFEGHNTDESSIASHELRT